MAEESAGASYLALLPWDIDRWQNSSAFRRMPIGAQGAYRNLCDSAWKQQPSCELPDDDRELWRLSNCRSMAEWVSVKADVFNCDAWHRTDAGTWLNEVVLETFQESHKRHAAAVRSGRIAGKASARARRALAQAKREEKLRTTVQRPSTQGRSTTVNPPSPSPSLSPSESTEKRTTEFTAIAVPVRATVVRKPAESWSAQAVDDHRARYGPGSGHPAQIGAGLKPLVTANGWVVVRAAWRRYLGLGPGPGTTHPAPSAQDFAAHFGDWLPEGRGPETGARQKGNVAMMAEALAMPRILEPREVAELERNRNGAGTDAHGGAEPTSEDSGRGRFKTARN